MTDKLELYEDQLNTLIDMAIDEDIGAEMSPVNRLFPKPCRRNHYFG